MSEIKDSDKILTQYTSLIAHQMKSPVAAASSILSTLLQEYVGTLTPQQKELIDRANRRLTEAITTSNRMIDLSKPEVDTTKEMATNVPSIINDVYSKFFEEAIVRRINLDIKIEISPVYVKASKASLTEVLVALVNNAFKYTPDNGEIEISLAKDTNKKKIIILSVSDSGIGVPKENYEKIFNSFYRSNNIEDLSIPGTGLGLSLVKSIVSTIGGEIEIFKSHLGGAGFRIFLRSIENKKIVEDKKLNKKTKKVVIVGGVAAGPKVASKIIRINPQTEVTVIDRGDILSYSGCGLPYYVSGIVNSQKELISSSVKQVRDPVFFQNVKNVVTMNRTEVVSINRSKKQVKIKSLTSNSENILPYDKLVLATGSTPIIPRIENIMKYKEVFTLHGVHDAEKIKAIISQNKAQDVAIIGGGLIGVEMTEALVSRGCRVNIIEEQSHILNILDEEISLLVEKHMQEHGVRIYTNTRAKSLHKVNGKDLKNTENKLLNQSNKIFITTDRETVTADFVIIAAGVSPDTKLAKEVNLEIGVSGAIKVNNFMQTSDPNIYAAGDCAEKYDINTKEPCYIPLGSTANKEGRTAAINICGGREKFPGITGSMTCKVFDFCVARTGLTEKQGRESGKEIISAYYSGPDKEHFMPNVKTLIFKLIVNRKTRKIVGAQTIGTAYGCHKIDIISTAISSGLTVDDTANLDLCYAPSYSIAMNSIITASNIAKNKLAGIFNWITSKELNSKIKDREEILLLDVRSLREYEELRIPNSTIIPLGVLRGRMHELPKDKEIVTFCSVSLRGYEAALILQAAGFKNVKVLDGGLAMWPYELLKGML